MMHTIAKSSDESRAQVADAYTVALARAQAGERGCCDEPTVAAEPCCDDTALAAEPCCGDAATTSASATATSATATSATATTESCCGPATSASASCCGEPAASIDVTESVTSFGCGNPLAFAGVQPGETVVDLGSGAGYDLLVAASKVGDDGHVIGIDMTDAMIAAARANASRAGMLQIEVRKGLIEELPVADGTADWVISNCVINLSPEKHRVFEEIERVLKPGGQFSISDIVAEDLPEEIRSHSRAYSACVSGAIREDNYVAGLMAAGLTDIEVSERHVYNAAQIRSFIGSELENLGMAPDVLEDRLASLEGKFWSARFRGRKAVA